MCKSGQNTRLGRPECQKVAKSVEKEQNRHFYEESDKNDQNRQFEQRTVP